MTEDTGSNYWEDLDTIQAGGNYGWPFKEGNCGSCGYLNPAFEYGHFPTDGAASAIAAYSGSTFPASYDHVVFFGDYVRNDIEAVSFDPDYQTGVSDYIFDLNAGTIADLIEGPDGNLYFVSIFEGTLSKISATGPFPPTASATATPNAGGAPLAVQFSSAASSDPYSKPLTESWDFGDGTPVSTSANPVHTYIVAGTYTATLTVSNGAQTSSTTTKVAVGPDPPTVAHHRADELQRRPDRHLLRHGHRSHRRHAARLRLHLDGRRVRERGAPTGHLRRGGWRLLRSHHRLHLRLGHHPHRSVPGTQQLLPDHPVGR